MKNELNDRKVFLVFMIMLGLTFIVFGTAYAFFSYSKDGIKTVSLDSSNAVKLHYQEGTNQINIPSGLPIDDVRGKIQEDYFEFTITGETSTFAVPYIIAARVSTSSANRIPDSYISVYLTEVNNGVENEVLFTTYDQLEQVSKNNYIEEKIYDTTIPVNTSNYEKVYRLRFWINETADFTPTEENGIQTYPMQGKEFALTINVYTNAQQGSAHDYSFNIVGSPKQNLEVGDEVAIDSEHFLVVSSNQDTTLLLAKYNLALLGIATMPGSVGGLQYIPTSEFISILDYTDPWDEPFMHYGYVNFSETAYYLDNGGEVDNSYLNNELTEGNNIYVYNSFFKLEPVYEFKTCLPSDLAEEDNNNGDTANWDRYSDLYDNIEKNCEYPSSIGNGINSFFSNVTSSGNYIYSVAYYVEEYKTKLETLGAIINDARLLNKSEFESISPYLNDYDTYHEFGMLRNFWLGFINEEDYGTYQVACTHYDKYDDTNPYYIEFKYIDSNGAGGVRPVIEVPTSSIKIN